MHFHAVSPMVRPEVSIGDGKQKSMTDVGAVRGYFVAFGKGVVRRSLLDCCLRLTADG